MRCRLILFISDHSIQQGIRKGGGPVGGFTRALHKPNGDPAPLARSSQMSKGRDLFCTSLFAQVGQEVNFIAGSSYHHDCLSATDSIRQPGPLYTGNESDEYRSKAPITFTFSHSQIKLPTWLSLLVIAMKFLRLLIGEMAFQHQK